MSEIVLNVGSKGEIYTNGAVRKKIGIRKKGKVKARVSAGKLIIEPMPSLEELISTPIIKIGVKDAEKLSEQAQKERGAYG